LSGTKRAVLAHRRRQKDRGMIRLEVQVAASDAGLIRALAAALRGDGGRARRIRAQVQGALQPEGEPSLLDLLACDLPDALVEEALARPRDVGREIALP
jgi:hypothetical protein